MLQIQFVDYEALRKHGEETYPHECCGVLLGKSEPEGNIVREIVRAGNTRTDSAHNRYNIAPQELVKIQRQARGLGLDIVGKAAVTNSFLLSGTAEDNKKFEDESIEIEIAEAAANNKKGQA